MRKLNVFLFFLLTACLGGREMVIVKNGKPVAQIVLPTAPSDEIKEAGLELQKYIEKCTGAKLNISGENEIEDKNGLSKNLIYVGPCEKTKEVIDVESLKPEELVILTKGSCLFITGDNDGTLYGVYQWLKKYLGVDWVLPGELGEVTPHTSSLSLSEVNYRYQPPVQFRNLRNIPWGKERSVVPSQKILELAGIENIKDSLKKAKQFLISLPEPPFQKWGAGGRVPLKFGHSFDDYWKKYGKDHLDFFAMQPNGSRVQKQKRPRLCVSNPELWDFIAERKIEEFKKNPQQEMASIAPNDGGSNRFCMCDKCRSWDPPEAPKIKSKHLVNPETGETFEEYPSLSDRYFRFYNEVAERVAKVYPNKKLGVYAYSIYLTVPVAIDKIHPNLVVELVSMDRELIDGWSKLTIPGQLYLRPNSMWPHHGGKTLGFVRNTARWHAETIRYAVEKGVQGFDFDGGIWNWGVQGLEYYVLVNAMWNPWEDIDKLINDYHHHAFGAGAASLLKYHQKVEELNTKLRGETRYKGIEGNPEVLAEYYSENFIEELQQYIDNAKSAVKDKTSKEYKRILLVEEGLIYTRLGSRLLKIAANVQNHSDPEYLTAEKDFHKHLASNMRSYSINPGRTYFYYQLALNAAKRQAFQVNFVDLDDI